MIDDDERKKLRLQAMQNLRDKRLDEAQKRRFATSDKSMNLAKGQLDKDVFKVEGKGIGRDLTEPKTIIKGGNANMVEPKTTIKGVTDKIDTRGQTRVLSPKQADLMATIRKAEKTGDTAMLNKLKKYAGKFGKTGLKSLPLVGGIASAVMSGDAAAAIPGLDSAESVGMSPAQEDMFIAEQSAQGDYLKSQARKDKLRALRKLSGQE